MSEQSIEWKPVTDVTGVAAFQVKAVGTYPLQFRLSSKDNPGMEFAALVHQSGAIFRFDLVEWTRTINDEVTALIRLVPDNGIMNVFVPSSYLTPDALLASAPESDARQTMPSESQPPPVDPPHP
jgi:hypothetical protein